MLFDFDITMGLEYICNDFHRDGLGKRGLGVNRRQKDVAPTPADREAPSWNMWQAIFVLLLYYVGQYVLGLSHIPIDLSSNEAFFQYILGNGGRFVLGVGLVWVGLLLIKGSWEKLGINRFRLRYLLIGLVAGIGLALAVSVAAKLLSWLFGEPAPQVIVTTLQSVHSPWQVFLLCLCTVVLAPMVEELLFRGLLYPPIRALCSPFQAMCLVALIFAAFHFDLFRFIPLFIGAVGLTLLLEKTRSLWPGIVAHGVWNLIMLIVVLLQKENVNV